MKEQLSSAFSQVLVVLVLSLIIYGISYFFIEKSRMKKSFFDFLGLKFSKSHFDKRFFIIFIGLILYGVISTIVQFKYSVELRELLMSESSPYYKIIKPGFTLNSILLGLIYCFIQSSASEEILFRGLIAPRLVAKFGLVIGNTTQALLFWLMHLIIFKLITGVWFSQLQLFAFATSFLLGLLLGYVNFRNMKNSIWPSWLLHSFANFSTFITLGLLV